MSNKQKNIRKEWLSNLYSICTLITLLFIMAQAYFARRSMIQSSEWEKAKLTIENIEHFKEKLKETELYGKTEVLMFADKLWPDFSTPEGFNASDTLRYIYWSFFMDESKLREDFDKTLSILDAFAYPIVMGYASEIGSFQSAKLEYFSYGAFIMPFAFSGFPHLGHHAKLLHRLWRVRGELMIIPNLDLNEDRNIEFLTKNINNMLCFEGTEITHASIKQYEKKLDKELKKIQKEIGDFRKSSLK
jgi:hypothetical protein